MSSALSHFAAGDCRSGFNPATLSSRALQFGVTYSDMMEVNQSAESWRSWADLLTGKASGYARLADRAAKQQRFVSAVEFWRRAAAYYHFAQLRLPFSSPSKKEYQILVRDNFQKAAVWMRPQAQRIEIPFGTQALPGYLRQTDSSAPLVVLIGGLDSEKEVELSCFAEHFLARGNSVFFFDGPGQGELSGKLTMETCYSQAVSTILDFLQDRGKCTNAIGLFGVSFGGYLACRAAACDWRVRACVCLGGFFDGRILQRLPETAKEAVRAAFGLRCDDDVLCLQSRVTLAHLAGNMDRPLFVVHGCDDHLVDGEQIDALEQWAAGPKVVWRINGGEHVCTNRFSECLPEIADWMTEHAVASGVEIGEEVCTV